MEIRLQTQSSVARCVRVMGKQSTMQSPPHPKSYNATPTSDTQTSSFYGSHIPHITKPIGTRQEGIQLLWSYVYVLIFVYVNEAYICHDMCVAVIGLFILAGFVWTWHKLESSE